MKIFYCKEYLLLILIVLAFFSCKDENTYSVPNDFLDYVQRFQTEASIRGKNYDFNQSGLIIEFADLTDGKAGLCNYENPIRIQFDKKYWGAISKSAGTDLMKEDLVFHELGHGILGRNHNNKTLENGEWKSIMCGGDKVNNRSWNINYRGLRRKYYIDELFNENTAAPDFASLQLPVDTDIFFTKISLNFESEQQSGWKLTDTNGYKTTLENGELKFQSKSSATYLVFSKTNINVQSDFTYELNIRYLSTGSDKMYGLIFGTEPDSSNINATESIEYMGVSNYSNLYIGNRTWYSYYTELKRIQIIPAGNNLLKVMKLGNMLYYFINNIYSYSCEMENMQDGYYYGFMVPANAIVWIDNLKIGVRNSSAVRKVNKQPKFINFNVKTVDENSLIYNF